MHYKSAANAYTKVHDEHSLVVDLKYKKHTHLHKQYGVYIFVVDQKFRGEKCNKIWILFHFWLQF